MTTTVTIAGQEPDGFLGAEDEQVEGDQLGGSTVRVLNSQTNRALAEPGAVVTVRRDGTLTHTGVITGTPSTGDGVLKIKTEDRRAELGYSTLHRVFFDVESSEAVKQAVTEQARPLSETQIHVGSDLTDWRFDAPITQLYKGARAGLYDRGTDLIFIGVPQGTSGTLTATYGGVTERMIADGFYKLITRFLVANAGSVFSAAVELTTPSDTTYVWDIDDPVSDFGTYELPAQEARPDGQVSETGTLQYRFSIDGTTSENRGCWLDFSTILPHRLRDRATALSVAGVESTGRTIRRRADGRTSKFLDELATEDEYDWWIEGDTLYYQPGAAESSSLSIEEGTTPVTDYDLSPSFDSVTNVVTVQGAGDVEVTVSDGQSVDFYGIAARRRTVVDKTIQTESEARARANGILRDEANDDLGMTWTVADSDFAALSPANNLPLVWPSEDLDATYAVTSVATNDNGTVTVGLTGSSQNRTT